MILLTTILILRAWSQSAESKKVVTTYEGYVAKGGVTGWIGYAA